jgi:trk system potassium uptake protein
MTDQTGGRLAAVAYPVGLVVAGLGALQWIPLLTALLSGEWTIALVFLTGSSVTLLCGGALALVFARHRGRRLGWSEGMAATALSWFFGMIFCALPYYLSGSYLSYLDACFDVMSGLTTTGLTLIQDMDHASNGVNMWRHLLTWLGGQGIVVLALTFLFRGTNGAYKMYVGEGKDERLTPNVVNTARSIWAISLIYLVVGTTALWGAGLVAGLPPDRAFLHGLWIFLSAWSTGGFAPMSQSILYYHSLVYEVTTAVFFLIGSFNFALHYAVLTGQRREIRKNIEIVSFSVTVVALTLVSTFGLMRAGVYPDAVALFRKGFYQLISGHTTTGFMTVYARQFYHEWGDLALFALIVAMLIGGSACSTAGGFKGLRVGIIFRSFMRDIRKLGAPESMVSVVRIHHVRDATLDDGAIRGAMLIVFAYIATFSTATLIGMLYGIPFAQSAFESASVTGNVGLSIGVTSAVMPVGLKLTYLVTIWLARLEFLSILALGAYLLRNWRKK